MLAWIIIGYVCLVIIALLPAKLGPFIRFILAPLVLGGVSLALIWYEWSNSNWDFRVLKPNPTTINERHLDEFYTLFIMTSSIFISMGYALVLLYGIGLYILSLFGGDTPQTGLHAARGRTPRVHYPQIQRRV